ncbi:MAG TPA: hypothetical protein VFQ25_16740 [Ktedonobacterales bacterium]|nr:hypothetical protein [Ktedonobacterales bacterium]
MTERGKDTQVSEASSTPATAHRRGAWLRTVTLLLIAEKVIQHVAVTSAFALDYGGIRASVALDYRLFMVAGAASAVLFALSGWALVQRKPWTAGLLVALALVDIVGEFLAQGTLMITINVSILVATALLVLSLFSLRGAGSARAR